MVSVAFLTRLDEDVMVARDFTVPTDAAREGSAQLRCRRLPLVAACESRADLTLYFSHGASLCAQITVSPLCHLL